MRTFQFFMGLFLGAGLLFSVAVAQPTSHIKTGMPDLDQRNPARPAGGNFHCTPTAAANSLQWFDNRGIDTVDGDPNALVDTLAGIFNTNGGTWSDDLVKGLRSYLWGRFLQTGKLWDVKFQGSTWNRGYTVGQVAPLPDLAWIKNELADDEDVLLNVEWYTETPPGSGTYKPGGGHTITASGFLGDDLLISDPWYPELIVEPANVPGVPGPAYRYSTDPANPNLIAVIREAFSVSPKDLLSLDGIVDPFEYIDPPVGPTTTALYRTDYIDYLSLGIDFKDIPSPLAPADVVTLEVFSPAFQNGLRVTYNGDGLMEVLQWDPDPTVQDFTLPLPPEFVRVASNLGLSPDEPWLPPHLQSELFINKEGLGDFPVDSFFDITYRIDFDGLPGPAGLLGEQMLVPQQASLNLPPWGDRVPFEYPNPVPPEFDPIEFDQRLLVEQEIFAIASDFNDDGTVDLADYTVWRDNLGVQVPSGQIADANFDGVVGMDDYLRWRQNFGRRFQPLSSALVPEPGGILILPPLVVMLLNRCRSRP